jgi:glucan phosphoethanolaminetransferase (alkaline phosphatase superfamily)
MDIADLIGMLAIILECLIAVIAVLIASRNGKEYGWLIAITFALFALFDLVRIFLPLSFPRLHALILLVACSSMLYAVWLIYDNTKKSG